MKIERIKRIHLLLDTLLKLKVILITLYIICDYLINETQSIFHEMIN